MRRNGVMKLIRNIKYRCKRDTVLWKPYDEASKNDKFFFTELGKFLESYEKCLNQLKEMEEEGKGSNIGYMRIMEKLNQHSSANKKLHKKIIYLIEKRQNLQESIGREERLGKKYGCVRAWRPCLRMVTYVVFIGAAAAQFACTVVTAVLATPLVALAIASAIIPTLAGQHWVLSWIEDSPFEDPVNFIHIFQAEIEGHIFQLEDTKRDVKSVQTDITSLLDILNSLIQPEPLAELTISEIKSRLEKLNDLKLTAGNCKTTILKTKDEVSNKLRRASTTE